MKSVYVHGRGLLCGLGGDLNAVVQSIKERRVLSTRVALPDGSSRPYITIADLEGISWRARIERGVKQAVDEAGVAHLSDAPLIIASSCINISEIIETGEFPDACFDFARHIKKFLNWRGEVVLIPVACTAAMQAMLLAKKMIQKNFASDVIILGVELENRVTTSGFASMQLLSLTGAKPLGETRDGMVLGEAVAVLHLSNHPARWQLVGGSSVVSGADATGAAPAVVAEVVHLALLEAQLESAKVGLIKLQAAGSPQNDLNELVGLEQIFPIMPPLTTLKHLLGHTLGASGMVELMVLIACFTHGVEPFFDLLADENVPHIMADELPAAEYILSIILGFGGEHAALVFKDHERGGV